MPRTMDTQTVTLALPESLYRTARQVAEAIGQPLEVILQASLAHALPPLDDVPSEEMADLAALASLDDAALWRVARATLSEADQSELGDLLDRQSAGELAPTDSPRLQALLDAYGQVTLRKAHAYLLLARRGYHVPMQDPPG